MSDTFKSDFPGMVGLIEPIMVAGKGFGIKLLSVYDFLRCELMCRKLSEKLSNQGFDRQICEKICERACVISMCLYNSKNERIFVDGFSVLTGLTPEEMQNIYGEYAKLNKKVLRFDRITSGIVKSVKKGEYENIY